MAESSATPSALLLRSAGFLALWIVLIGPAAKDLPFGLVASAGACWASALLWPPGGRLSLAGLARFLIRFLPQSAEAGFDVARRAFSPVVDLRPGFATFRSGIPAGMAREAACAVMSLQPGKLPVAEQADGTLLVHCLDLRQPIAEELAADEAALRGVSASQERRKESGHG